MYSCLSNINEKTNGKFGLFLGCIGVGLALCAIAVLLSLEFEVSTLVFTIIFLVTGTACMELSDKLKEDSIF